MECIPLWNRTELILQRKEEIMTKVHSIGKMAERVKRRFTVPMALSVLTLAAAAAFIWASDEKGNTNDSLVISFMASLCSSRGFLYWLVMTFSIGLMSFFSSTLATQ